MDDVHRSRSVMDHNRQSRRDIASDNNSHIRSKSADYLMDKKYFMPEIFYRQILSLNKLRIEKMEIF